MAARCGRQELWSASGDWRSVRSGGLHSVIIYKVLLLCALRLGMRLRKVQPCFSSSSVIVLLIGGYADEILILHKNITKTQKSLFSALSTSLEEAWESITAQKSFGGIWKTTLNGVLEDLAETKGKVMDALRDAGANATGIIKNLTQELEVRREEQIRTVSELNQVQTSQGLKLRI
jgi:hypothetical protein